MAAKRKPCKSHWYRIHIGECPPCGRKQDYRERVYGPKPKRREDRYVYMGSHAAYCGCIDREFY